MKEFFGTLARTKKSGGAEIIEKDYQLHRLLHRISQNEYLNENLIFKGGTCLVKAYTGYYRFSEDIDFTRKQDHPWTARLKKGTKQQCSVEITKIVQAFKEISDDLLLKFSGDKSNDYTKGGDVNIRAGGRMLDLWIGYKSEVSEVPITVKIQVNLEDMILYPIVNRPLQSYVESKDLEKLRKLYKEPSDEYSRVIHFGCYDSKEIFVEKCRAAMTRIAYKPRDIVDIYIMEREYGYRIQDYQDVIVEKTIFMLQRYRKYRESIQKIEYPKVHILTNEEEKLMLRTLPPDFRNEATRIHSELIPLRQEIMSSWSE